MCEDAADVREFHEHLHDLFGLPGSTEDIDIVHRLLPPSDAPGNHDLADGRTVPDPPDDVLGEGQHPAERTALAPAFYQFYSLQYIFFGLLPDVRQAGEFPGTRDGFQF